jgi:hypothetical protein
MTWKKTYAIDSGGLFEASLSAAVNVNVSLRLQPFGGFHYAPLNTPKVQVGRLGIEDG